MSKTKKIFQQIKEFDIQNKKTSNDFIDKIVDIDEIKIENQSRKNFDPDKINELANSIKEKGLINPITLHILHEDEYIKEKNTIKKYVLVAGERRLKAVQILKYKNIRARIKRFESRTEIKTTQLIENLQREDLTNFEKAESSINLIIEVNNWKKMSIDEVYSKLLELRNNSDDKGVSFIMKLSEIGLGLNTLLRYCRMLSYPEPILSFFKQNQNIPFVYIDKFYSIKDKKTDEVLEIFKKIISNEPFEKEIDKLFSDKKSKKKAPEKKKEIRLVSSFNKIHKSLMQINSQINDKTKVKEKEKILEKIEELSKMLEEIKKRV